jgi:hypothetical protein
VKYIHVKTKSSISSSSSGKGVRFCQIHDELKIVGNIYFGNLRQNSNCINIDPRIYHQGFCFVIVQQVSVLSVDRNITY